ncbi:DUF86 domain-containing protein [soil metagenome]
MSSREWRIRIEDILEALAKIERYTSELDYTGFCQNEMAIDAVIRNLEVIGEASNFVPSEIRSQYNNLPWTEMRGLRNILAHEYFNVDLQIIWHTITHDLSLLSFELKKMLEYTLK